MLRKNLFIKIKNKNKNGKKIKIKKWLIFLTTYSIILEED